MIQSLEEFETASHPAPVPLAADACKEASAESEALGSASGSMMAMRLATPGLQFDIQTALDTNTQLVALTARLELTSEMLQDMMRRLEAAHMRIGQLESELGHKREKDRQEDRKEDRQKALGRDLEKDFERESGPAAGLAPEKLPSHSECLTES